MNSRAWDRLRRRCLNRDGWRCTCGRYGNEAHHLVPVHVRPDLEDKLDNLRALCRGCHIAVHQAERQRPDPERAAWRALLRST